MKKALSIKISQNFEWIIIQYYSESSKLWRGFCWNFEIWAVQRIVNLVDLEKMLQNPPTLAIVAVDTAENEPLEVWRKWMKFSIHSLLNMTPGTAGIQYYYRMQSLF